MPSGTGCLCFCAQVYHAGRRLLVDPNDGQVYEESRPGDTIWSIGRLELGRLDEVDVLEQWSFITTLSTRLHRQHSQVCDAL